MNAVYAKHYWIGLQLLIFWPVWQWYVKRLVDGSDEPFGILALLAALAIPMMRGRRQEPASNPAVFRSTAMVLVYALVYPILPFLGRALLSVLAVGLLLSPYLTGRRLQPGLAGLLILSLPLIASLQFFGGFPIRFLTAHLSGFLLSALGWSVEAQGTLLHWRGEVIAVDQPCAGVKMLWTGLWLNFCLASWFDLDFLRTWLATSWSMACVFVGNVLRATLLFFVESGIVPSYDWAHSGIGLFVFVLVALAILVFHSRLQQAMQPCAI